MSVKFYVTRGHTLTIRGARHQLCGAGWVFTGKPIHGTLHWDGSGSRGGGKPKPGAASARDNRGGPTRYIRHAFLLQLSEVVFNYFFTLRHRKRTVCDPVYTEEHK